jgi:hypothetical protein
MSGELRVAGMGAGAILVLSLILCLCAGCTSTTVGNAWYENESVRTMITHTGEPADIHVQVTVYRISSLTQEQYTVLNAPVTLSRGDNLVTIPGNLPSGTYKLYIYVLGDNDRKTAVIRDITV